MRVLVEFTNGAMEEMLAVLLLWIEDGRLHTERGSWPLDRIARVEVKP